MKSATRDRKATTKQREAGLKNLALGMWKKGESGNPNGRPQGTREQLAGEFFAVLQKACEEHGAKVMETLAKEQPDLFAEIMIRVLPADANAPQSNHPTTNIAIGLSHTAGWLEELVGERPQIA